MKIVSFVTAATVAVMMMTLIGCPGTTPKPSMETSEPPKKQEFTGTFAVEPASLFMGTITATIVGISRDGTALAGPMLAGALEAIGGDEQKFNYTLMPAADRTGITLTGMLLEGLGLPGGMVTAERSGPPDPPDPTNPLKALNGMWTTKIPDPQTMATTTLTLEIMFPEFKLTVDTTPASS